MIFNCGAMIFGEFTAKAAIEEERIKT